MFGRKRTTSSESGAKQQHNRPILLVLALGLLLITATSSANAQLHPDKPNKPSPCATASYLRQLAINAINFVQTAVQQVDEGHRKAAQLRALASSSAGSTKTAAFLLAAELTRQAQAANAAIKANLPTTAAAALAAKYLSGWQEAIDEFSTTKMKDTVITAAASAIGGTAYLATTPETSPGKHGACLKDSNTRTDANEATVSHPTGKIQIDFTVLKPVTPATTTIAAPLTFCGASANAGASPDDSKCGDAQTTNYGYKGGPIFQAQTITATAKTAGDDQQNEYTLPTAQGTLPSTTTLQYKLTTISQLVKTASQLQAATVDTDLKSLATSAAMKSALAKSLRPDKPNYGDKETQQAVDEFIKNTFGEKGEKVETEIISKLNAVKPPKGVTDGAADKNLLTITDPNELAAAEAYYTVTGYLAEQEEKKKNQAGPSCPTKTEKPADPPKSPDECKKHTTEKPCKEEKGCDFDEKKDPKCFPKAETDKKDEKSVSRNLRVSVPQVFAAFVALLF
uniref:Variant surface glycoprotein n=1 Tax=Trypanosoma brucei TaxID=5691 RepID=A0A1V0FXU1_9TRYP|nr:variant surface glycoprotein [Trypanosoma brucei]